MSYEDVISGTKKIESLLVKMGAEGRGLHEKVSSIKSSLPPSLVKKIRFIASVRNKLIHEDGFSLDDDLKEGFFSACRSAEAILIDLLAASDSKSDGEEKSYKSESLAEAPLWKKAALAGLAIAAAAYFSS